MMIQINFIDKTNNFFSHYIITPGKHSLVSWANTKRVSEFAPANSIQLCIKIELKWKKNFYFFILANQWIKKDMFINEKIKRWKDNCLKVIFFFKFCHFCDTSKERFLLYFIFHSTFFLAGEGDFVYCQQKRCVYQLCTTLTLNCQS